MTPAPQGALSFALVGEIRWCTDNPTSWAVSLAARALVTRSAFETSTDVSLVQRALLCNITSSQSLAESCATSDQCPSTSSTTNTPT
jgi:hypothetical protein